MLVADGDPGRVLGLLDAESDLWESLDKSGHFAVMPLGPGDRQLADRFAGLMPAPGGLFASGDWVSTPYGPVLASAGAWAGCRLESSRECGWALLVEGVIEKISFDRDTAPLIHYRGRYIDR
jgi:3-hydroxy-9,10-secoandrosta-1,3,5(10)-triene-9,17-dione monooxygenase reductase component